MKRHNILVMGTVALAGLAVGARAQAGTFTTTAFTGDADCGISTAKIYTHAADCAGTEVGGRTVNGVTLERGMPDSTGGYGTNWSLSGCPNGLGFGWGGTGNVTGMIGDWADDGHNGGVLSDFWYGYGDPVTTLTLTGLTTGTHYLLTLYNQGWGDPGGRVQTVTTSIDSTPYVYDENWAGSRNGNLLMYDYVANAETVSLAFATADLAACMHMYGFTNEIVPEPSTLLLLVVGLFGCAWRKRA